VKQYPIFIFLAGFSFSLIKELNPTLINTEFIQMKDIQCSFKFIEKFWTSFINNKQTKYFKNEIFKDLIFQKTSNYLINFSHMMNISKSILKLGATLWKKPIVKAFVEIVKCSSRTTGDLLLKSFALAQLIEDMSLNMLFSVNFFQIPKLVYKIISTTYSIYKFSLEKDSPAKWNLLGKAVGKTFGLIYKVILALY
jgi:hypothetical protein